MIIQFAQTASYWMQQYEQALAKQRHDDALRYVHRALQTDTSFAVWFAYAELLHSIELYDMSVAVCLRYGRQKLSRDQQREWAHLMAENAHATGNFPAVFHYNRLLLSLEQPDEETDEMFYDLVSQFFDEMGDKDEGELRYSEDAHQEQNRAVYDEMIEAYQRDDYATVLALYEEIHPDYDFYTECLFAVGKSQLALGLIDEGVATLCTMYMRSQYDARILYHLCDVEGALTPESLAQYLAFIDDSSADNLDVAVMCAGRMGLDDLALQLAQRAYRLAPLNPIVVMRLACAYANVGQGERCRGILQQIMALYPDFYPSDLLRTIPDRFDLTFSLVPCELTAELVMYVADVLAASPDCRDYRLSRDIYYMLVQGFPDDYKEAVTTWFEGWTDADSNEFASDLLAEPALQSWVRQMALFHLLQNRRRGKVNVARNYLCESYSLRVPPSYADYSPALRRSYACAFCDMASFGLHHERKLVRLYEQLYLQGFDVGYSPDMAGFAVLVAGRIAPEKVPLHDHLAARGYDDVAFQYYLDAVREALDK